MVSHDGERIIVLLVALLLANQQAYAQQGIEVEDIITTSIASFAFIIIAILALMIYKRVSSRRRDSMFDSTGLDLMSLRNKGLLTPEEMEKVSRSIARRLEEKEAARKRAASRPTPDALLLDPEIRRLQALADATEIETAGNRKLEKPEALKAESLPTASDVMVSATEPATVPARATEESAASTAPAEDIELPPEVQQLADAGVLTPEEIETVKQRLRNRKQDLQY